MPSLGTRQFVPVLAAMAGVSVGYYVLARIQVGPPAYVAVAFLQAPVLCAALGSAWLFGRLHRSRTAAAFGALALASAVGLLPALVDLGVYLATARNEAECAAQGAQRGYGFWGLVITGVVAIASLEAARRGGRLALTGRGDPALPLVAGVVAVSSLMAAWSWWALAAATSC
jgi:hypothetical protein